MTDFQSDWEARQRARWLRPDAAGFMRPDYKRYLQSDYERRFLPPGLDRKYSPDQPRDWHGRWTNGGGSGGGEPAIVELSAQRKPSGHHFVAQGVYRDLPLKPETRAVFEGAKTGPLRDPTSNRYDALHRAYNDAIAEKLSDFMAQKGVTAETMTPSQAQEFVDFIKNSSDPRVRNLNMRIYMREFYFGFGACRANKGSHERRRRINSG